MKEIENMGDLKKCCLGEKLLIFRQIFVNDLIKIEKACSVPLISSCSSSWFILFNFLLFRFLCPRLYTCLPAFFLPAPVLCRIKMLMVMMMLMITMMIIKMRRMMVMMIKMEVIVII